MRIALDWLAARGARLADPVLAAAAFLVAFAVDADAFRQLSGQFAALLGLLVTAAVMLFATNTIVGVNRADWDTTSAKDVISVWISVGIVGIALGIVGTVLRLEIGPGTILTGAALCGSFELMARLLRRTRARGTPNRGGEAARLTDVIVVGAGRMGQLLAADLAYGPTTYRIACFVDDDLSLRGRYIRGICVAGTVGELAGLIQRYKPALLAIAVSDPSRDLVRRVVNQCEESQIPVRRLTKFSLDATSLQPIAVEELLARDVIDLRPGGTAETFTGQVIMVTGAAGSIGSELSRQLRQLGHKRLLLLDTNESGLYNLLRDLEDERAELILADIRDRASLSHVFASHTPDVVFHCAAYKHVPILEQTPLAGIATNVVGTRNVLECCISSSVERFVFVSSDKAVEPTNVLGYTKRFGELLTIAMARAHRANFAVVRFGNVLGSSGSAVPIFERQITQGGPLTVTHPEATRFFMTIPEAVGLLIAASAMVKPGDVLVLDMGSPVSIADLARKMIRLRGLRTPEDIQIEFIGLRPGEKLHEQLFFSDEQPRSTPHPRVWRAESLGVPDLDALWQALHQVELGLARHDSELALMALRHAIGSAEKQTLPR